MTVPVPVPEPTPVSQPFWDGLGEHRIRIQYSPSTDRYVFYPRVLAPGTLADDLEWREAATTALGAQVIYMPIRRSDNRTAERERRTRQPEEIEEHQHIAGEAQRRMAAERETIVQLVTLMFTEVCLSPLYPGRLKWWL